MSAVRTLLEVLGDTSCGGVASRGGGSACARLYTLRGVQAVTGEVIREGEAILKNAQNAGAQSGSQTR
jgi:hypothetical protein